ncbi:MAG: tRNA uridine-5-carboxymethylaminomethyl(34) synthesis enzyme MnmG [Candidatus Cloacimonadota bacterium]|nr:MAG: tRNA uridine-5-carboxymethylaminomethyl(34) synthesis enzyme MnmG [Candidatus Cloacimonadota bacterium]
MQSNLQTYETIVIGAGHAGVEAALASARMGIKTLCLTISLDKVALMPCNPSIGGPAKGHIVREIDALGGQMGLTIDKTMLQIRTLNQKRGPAVQALRAQADKILYQLEMKRVLESEKNLFLRQGIVCEILEKNNKIYGVKILDGLTIQAKNVIITTGTFLNGKCHIGQAIFSAGRIGEPPATHLSDSLKSLGFRSGRLKTGTPPRVQASSIDFSKLEIQGGDEPTPKFSFITDKTNIKQLNCWITHTTNKTRQVITKNMHLSPMYNGQVDATGARYCPSIEDKFSRFPDKPSHICYLEPESRWNQEIYIQGMSTSLPHEVQIEMIQSLPGLDQAIILRPGYAVEYDYFNPIDLYPSLESKKLENLYFAGQINGTSGYEEAAGQGLIAGINSALKLSNKEAIKINRENSYIGVLIHDLVTKGTKEPYRMFTSLVEHRTWIRHDNADHRLTKLSYDAGLASQSRLLLLNKKRENILKLHTFLEDFMINSSHEKFSLIDTKSFHGRKSLKSLLKRPEITLSSLSTLEDKIINSLKDFNNEEITETITEIKYEGYINKQRNIIKQREKMSSIPIPKDFDFNKIKALSNEGRSKLEYIRPINIQQASLISGIRQSDLALLARSIHKKKESS